MLKTSNLLQRNVRLLYGVTFLESSFYIDAIYVLFGTHYLHLSYLKSGSLVFVGWFASILFDFLGGVFADKIGRKHAQLYGLALQFAGFVPYLFSRNYALLVAGSLLYGIGSACSSNTLQALVYEQVKEQGDTKLYQHINAMSQVWTFAGVAVAALVGGAAYALNPRLPYSLMLMGLAGAFIVCTRITVPHHTEREVSDAGRKKVTGGAMYTALRTFREHNELLYFVMVSFFWGITSDLLFSYYQPFYLTFHVTPLVFGVLYAVFRAISGMGSYAMRHLPDHLSLSMIQLISIIGAGVSALLMLVLPFPAVLAAPVIVAICFGFSFPVMRLFINKHASNSARAATLSFGSGVMNLGSGLGFVMAFWMADHYDPSVVLCVILAGVAFTLLLRVVTMENVWQRLLRRNSRAHAVPLQGD